MDVGADYFVHRDGAEFAGLHLLVEFWGAGGLDDADGVAAALRAGAEAAGAEVLDLRLHHFGPGRGVTGVALLAESHISVHTWPERGYVAIDVFMCGGRDPHAALPALKAAFRPARVELAEHRRGVVG